MEVKHSQSLELAKHNGIYSTIHNACSSQCERSVHGHLH